MDAPEERLGVKTGVVRFCPKSRHRCCVPARPLRARSGCEQMQQVAPLLDHLVGAAEQRDWKSDAERMGGLEIDDQLGFCGLLHREVGRLLAFEDASGIAASETVPVRNTASVAHQAAGSSERAILV